VGSFSITTCRRILSIAVASILLAAAGLKFLPLARDWQSHPQQTSILNLVGMEAEAVLGLWLLSGVTLTAAWHFTASFFVVAAAVNVRSWAVGQATCGCLGDVEMPPWISLLINCLILALLLALRPPLQGLWEELGATGRRANLLWRAPLYAVLLLLAPAAASLSALRPQPIIAEPSSIDLGTIDDGAFKEFSVTLRNAADREITIMGARASCTCVRVSGLPAQIRPGEQRSVQVKVTPPNADQFSGRVSFYTDLSTSLSPLVKYQGVRRQAVRRAELATP
jgi:hypothetical protein